MIFGGYSFAIKFRVESKVNTLKLIELSFV